jgi:hypothetical protein
VSLRKPKRRNAVRGVSDDGGVILADTTYQQRLNAARRLIRRRMLDGEIALSYVLWPTSEDLWMWWRAARGGRMASGRPTRHR